MAEFLMTVGIMAVTFGAATVVVALCAVGVVKAARAIKRHAPEM